MTLTNHFANHPLRSHFQKFLAPKFENHLLMFPDYQSENNLREGKFKPMHQLMETGKIVYLITLARARLNKDFY